MVANTNYQSCTVCSHKLDAVSPMSGDENAVPKEGDFTVCLYCCSILRFTENLRLRQLFDGEFEQIDDEDKETLEIAVRVIRKINNEKL